MGDDIGNAERLARIETKLDTVLDIIPDHESRIRVVEQRKEECQQDNRLNKIEGRLDGHDAEITDLKATHNQDAGAKQAVMSIREMAAWLLTIIVSLIAIWQFIGGKP